ncbi:collagenase-like [Bicyclus anynana]|uniref:Collagenase-like n=1 Tax=Bicyclus anynana TaxID=110368 RepID=A0ABM3LWC0_BICAN|nr:collagenase-like [Bicyclus anynana]
MWTPMHQTTISAIMKLLVIIFGLVAAVASEVEFPPIFQDYHEEIGIPAAKRIKLFEDSLDFDGSRIAGGQPGRLGSQPHLGGLIIALTDGRQSVCGCSLLSNTKAVTAAHCWRFGSFQARKFTAVFGSTRLFSGGHRTDTSNVVSYPKYRPTVMDYDVAVMTLDFVPFSNYIRAIAVATGTDDFVGVWASAAGFGSTGNNHPITQAQSKNEAILPVITNEVCSRSYGVFVLVPFTICGGTTHGQSTCPGDSGGPLAVGTGDDRKLIGIVSFGHISGCENGHPIGFSRVTYFAPWIISQL